MKVLDRATQEFEFFNFSKLSHGELDLVLYDVLSADQTDVELPTYNFEIRLHGQSEQVGNITLRIGENDRIYYLGQLDYEIYEEHQGNHYSKKACKIAAQLAKAHGMEHLWIAVERENIAARKTAEYLKAELVEVVDVPRNNILYKQGQRKKNRYKWDLAKLPTVDVGLP